MLVRWWRARWLHARALATEGSWMTGGSFVSVIGAGAGVAAGAGAGLLLSSRRMLGVSVIFRTASVLEEEALPGRLGESQGLREVDSSEEVRDEEEADDDEMVMSDVTVMRPRPLTLLSLVSAVVAAASMMTEGGEVSRRAGTDLRAVAARARLMKVWNSGRMPPLGTWLGDG